MTQATALNETMPAVWLEDRVARLRDDLPAAARPGEALLRVRLAGVCATDLEMVRGYYPFTGVMGHEFVGEVVSAPDATEWEGQRVVGEINAACRSCAACRAGMTSHCEQRTVLGIKDRDGVFARYTSLPLGNLYAVPAAVPDEMAVFTEPLAAALEIQEQVHLRPSQRVLVIGAGRLGQLVAQTLALTGCDLFVVARHPRQQALLAERSIPVIAEGQVGARRWDFVVDTSGAPSGFHLARQAVRPRGTLVLKSTFKDHLELNLSSLAVDEISLVGSRCGPFAPALRLMERRLVDPTPLIEARYPLSEALAALEHAGRPGALKVLIQP